MQISFAASFAKAPEYPEANEDCFLINSKDDRIVLCDGASESFDSRTWAQLLAQKFSDDPAINTTWVSNAVREYNAKVNIQTLSWSKQAAFDRGSFATLLAVEINRARNSIEILAVGDSIAILVKNNQIVASWPYTRPEQFDEHPSLLSTISELNNFVSEEGFYLAHQVNWDINLNSPPVLLCMTDALGQWVLRMASEGNDIWKQLLILDSPEQLSDLVITQRVEKKMRTDDSTLVVVRFEEENVV